MRGYPLLAPRRAVARAFENARRNDKSVISWPSAAQQQRFISVCLGPLCRACRDDAEFFPGLKKSWSYTFMVTTRRRRPAGQRGPLAGLGSPTRSFGSTGRTGSEAIGPRRSCPSLSPYRSPATWILKPRLTRLSARGPLRRIGRRRFDPKSHPGVPAVLARCPAREARNADGRAAVIVGLAFFCAPAN